MTLPGTPAPSQTPSFTLGATNQQQQQASPFKFGAPANNTPQSTGKSQFVTKIICKSNKIFLQLQDLEWLLSHQYSHWEVRLELQLQPHLEVRLELQLQPHPHLEVVWPCLEHKRQRHHRHHRLHLELQISRRRLLSNSEPRLIIRYNLQVTVNYKYEI